MKKLFISLILVLISCSVMVAQVSKPPLCPTIDVMANGGVPTPNEPITFTGEVGREAEKFNLKFVWTVTDGEIIEGQETLVIKVLQKIPEKNFTATLEVIGLPEKCIKTASDSVFFGHIPNYIQVDELSIPETKIDKARLDMFALEMQNHPTATAYIIEKFEQKTSGNTIKLKIQRLTNYLFNVKKIKRDRIIIWYANSHKTTTQFFYCSCRCNTSDLR